MPDDHHLAQDYPKRILGLVAMAAFARFQTNPAVVGFREQGVKHLTDSIDPINVHEFQESTLAQPVPSAFIETIVSESKKVPAHVWREVISGLLEDEHEAHLEDIVVPTLLVWGDQVAFTPRSDQDHLLAKIAGSRLEVYQGARHAVHWVDPARFTADLVTFVRGLAAGQGLSRQTTTRVRSSKVVAFYSDDGRTERMSTTGFVNARIDN